MHACKAASSLCFCKGGSVKSARCVSNPGLCSRRSTKRNMTLQLQALKSKSQGARVRSATRWRAGGHTDRAEVRQHEVAAIDLQHVSARCRGSRGVPIRGAGTPGQKPDREAHAALHNAYLPRRHVHDPELRSHPQAPCAQAHGCVLAHQNRTQASVVLGLKGTRAVKESMLSGQAFRGRSAHGGGQIWESCLHAEHARRLIRDCTLAGEATASEAEQESHFGRTGKERKDLAVGQSESRHRHCSGSSCPWTGWRCTCGSRSPPSFQCCQNPTTFLHFSVHSPDGLSNLHIRGPYRRLQVSCRPLSMACCRQI